jgi:hypothetical protein
MSGLLVATGTILGAVFAWRMIDLIGPEWTSRVARPVGKGVRWVSHRAHAAILALGLICLGGTAIVVGTLLPLGQPPFAFVVLRDNALVAHGGWALIALAVIAAAVGYRSYRTGSQSWSPSVLGLIALGIVIGMATHTGLRTGLETGLGALGLPGTPIVLPLAIGPYVAGAGAILVSIGGCLLRGAIDVTKRRSLLGSSHQIGHSLPG